MSIAVSILVRPSRLLRRALLLYGAMHAAMALWLLGPSSAPMGGGAVAALACLLVAGLAWRRACRNGTAWRIDVSGTGAVRATVQQESAARRRPAASMQLMPGSTLWPQLLCLCLQDDQRQGHTLLITPDSVTPEAFRALAVACRSIAGRDNIFFEKNKIV